MATTQHHPGASASPRRAVVGGVVATLLLVTLVGGLGALAAWGTARLLAGLLP